MSNSPTLPSHHIGGLDGLRAIACLAVFGVHFQQITGIDARWGSWELGRLLENGNTGVALFFVLSGFLLSLPFWIGKLAEPGRAWLLPYARARAVRLLPAYYACLTALAIQQRRWESPGDWLSTLSHYVFIHNYSESFFYGINPPFWTIAVQAQFYVVLAVVFWCLCRWTRDVKTWAATVTCLAVGAYVLHWLVMEYGDAACRQLGLPQLVARYPTVFSRSVLAHLPHLFLGVLAGGVYVLLKTRQASYRFMAWPFWLAGVAVFAILATPLDDLCQIPHGRYNLPLVPLLIAVAIVCAPLSQGVSRVLDCQPFKWLGQVSFGVYIYHLPCMRLVEREMPRAGLTAQTHWATYLGISLVLSILVAGLSYALFERPLMDYVRKRRAIEKETKGATSA